MHGAIIMFCFSKNAYMGDKLKKTVTGGYRPLPPVPEDQICVSLNICIYNFMNYLTAVPELTKNV